MTDDLYWSTYPDLLTAEHLAKLLRIGVPAVHARLLAERIPAHRIGRSWVVFKLEIRAWLAENSNQRVDSEPLPDVDVLADYPDELSYRDLMRLFGKTKPTICIWLNDGTIPACNFGGRWVILKPALEDMLRATFGRTDSASVTALARWGGAGAPATSNVRESVVRPGGVWEGRHGWWVMRIPLSVRHPPVLLLSRVPVEVGHSGGYETFRASS